MNAELAPDLAPDVLQDMKVIELNVGLWVNHGDRVDVSLAMIDVEGREIKPQSLQPF